MWLYAVDHVWYICAVKQTDNNGEAFWMTPKQGFDFARLTFCPLLPISATKSPMNIIQNLKGY